jgi:hypothetical protein
LIPQEPILFYFILCFQLIFAPDLGRLQQDLKLKFFFRGKRNKNKKRRTENNNNSKGELTILKSKEEK